MSENRPQENQQELFSDFAPPQQQQRVERAPGISKAPKPILISTTLEQLLFAGLILILVFCLIFFLGVLRGRYIAGPQFSSARAAVPAPASVRQPAVRPETAAAPVRTAPVSAPVRTASVATPAAAPPSAPTNADAKPYTIQILTTKKKAYADAETASLRARAVNAWMMRSGEYYVVCVGYFKNKDEAKKDLSALKGKYPSAYLRRR